MTWKQLKIFILSFGLLWSQLSLSMENNPKIIKELSLETYVKIHEFYFHKAIKAYNQRTKKLEDPLWGEKLISGFKSLKLSKLPKFLPKGEGYKFNFNGNSLFISPRLSYQGKILVNNKHVLKISGLSIDQIQKELSKKLNTKKFSAFSLIIPDANAAFCLGLCIAILVGGTAAIGYFTMDEGMATLTGDTDGLEKILSELRSKRRKCSEETRNVGLSGSKAVPGEQETFQDMQKLGSDLANYDLHYENENKTLHTKVFEELVGVQVNSCQEFGSLWGKNAGALAQRDQEGIDAVRSNTKAKTKEVCRVVDELAGCLYWFRKGALAHNGERRNGKAYDPLTGIYGELGISDKIMNAISR